MWQFYPEEGVSSPMCPDESHSLTLATGKDGRQTALTSQRISLRDNYAAYFKVGGTSATVSTAKSFNCTLTDQNGLSRRQIRLVSQCEGTHPLRDAARIRPTVVVFGPVELLAG